MKFTWLKGNEKLFVVFHGTGGNDTNLLFLTGELDAKASVLSFLGNVGAGKERRFFAPLVQGKVDKKDLFERVEAFLVQWDTLPIEESEEIVFIGYSNGANFILAILQERPDIADQTILLHPSQLGFDFKTLPQKNRIIATVGSNDYIAPPGQIVTLQAQLEKRGFHQFHVEMLDGSHGITDEEIDVLKGVLK